MRIAETVKIVVLEVDGDGEQIGEPISISQPIRLDTPKGKNIDKVLAVVKWVLTQERDRLKDYKKLARERKR